MNANNRLLFVVVQKLTRARLKPPTVAGVLLGWTSLPLLAFVGIVSVAALVALGLPTPVPVLMAGMFLGAALRDVGMAFRTVRFWPIHQELFDWQKIEALARGATDAQGKPITA